MATTSILPLTLGQAVLGRALELDGPAPEYLRIGGECWKLVTDPAAVAAAQAALEARERADGAFAMAQYAPRIANRPPVLADAEGRAAGAGWLEYDPATQLLKQMWRWDGTAWEPLPMDPVMIPIIQIGTGTAGDLTADRVVVTGDFVARVAQILELSVENLVVTEGATINELVALSIASATAEFQTAYIQNLRTNGAVIDDAVIGELASNLITSGLFRTAETGQRLEIDSNGLIMYGLDVDGGEYEMVRIGPSGVNLLTVGDTTVSPASVRSPAGSFDQLSVGGQSVDELLAGLPRGMVAWGQLTTSSQTDGDTSDYARRGELQTWLQPGRLHRIRLSEHFVEVSGTSNTNVVEELRYSFDGAPIYHGLTVDANNYQGVFSRSPVFAGAATTVNGMEFMLDTGNWSVGHGFWLMWMIRPEQAGKAVRILATSNYSPIMSVEDMGPSMPSTLKRWNDGDGGGTVDPEPTIVRRTDTWNHGGVGGDMKNGTVYQGTYNPYGNRWGGWIFPAAMRTALSGSTIEKIELYLENAHWYYGSGGTAVIYPNDGTYKGVLGSGTTSANWPRYAGRWVTLPSAWHASIVNGTYKGVSTYTTNTGLTFYGQFKGAPTKFRATFRKG